VNISAPKPLDPNGGARIAVDQQPLTFVVENASTSGVRPLSYLFEVATDIDFNSKVFTREGIAPGDGRTSMRLPDPLATGRTYYWRSKAQDGANTGPYSVIAYFNVFTPVVIGAPGAVSPIGNVTVDSLHPRFTMTNAPRSGPVGSIGYLIEISDADSFALRVAIWTVGEQSNQTSLDAPQDLASSKQYFWHARAFDPSTAGPWSATQVFQTPAPPPTPVPGPTPPGGGGGFSFGSVTIVGGSPNVASWPVTSQITSLVFDSTLGVFHIDHTKRGRWSPVPFGSTTQESTVWVFFKINGKWYGSGGERLRPNQTDKGLGVPSQMGSGWFYDGRWVPMTGYVPPVGDLVGFMVVAGDTRAGSNVILQERTGVVFIPMPPDGGIARFPPFAGVE
jgi:hypothetical protein